MRNLTTWVLTVVVAAFVGLSYYMGAKADARPCCPKKQHWASAHYINVPHKTLGINQEFAGYTCSFGRGYVVAPTWEEAVAAADKLDP